LQWPRGVASSTIMAWDEERERETETRGLYLMGLYWFFLWAWYWPELQLRNLIYQPIRSHAIATWET
jgi:hypothetical protein